MTKVPKSKTAPKRAIPNPAKTSDDVTLKDYFAVRILAALIVHGFNKSLDYGSLCESSYKAAEDMLSIRERRKDA